jgi:hypothetical protein
MVSQTIIPDNDAPTFGTAALADAPALEQALADDRRAVLATGDFDPAGLYAAEQERDWAASLLGETITDPAYHLIVKCERRMRRMDGEWKGYCEWAALAMHDSIPKGGLVEYGESPTEAVRKLIASWQAVRAARLVA